jgi:small subunit ribosomal protein S13
MIYNLKNMSGSPKQIKKHLRGCYGFNTAKILHLCERWGISPNAPAKELLNKRLKRTKFIIERKVRVGDRIRRIQIEAIRRFVANKSIKGSRLGRGLPVRGQRTRSNAQTPKRRRGFFIQLIENVNK